MQSGGSGRNQARAENSTAPRAGGAERSGDRGNRRVRSGDSRIPGGGGEGRATRGRGFRFVLRRSMDRTCEVPVGEQLSNLELHAGAKCLAAAAPRTALPENALAVGRTRQRQAGAVRPDADPSPSEVGRE